MTTANVGLFALIIGAVITLQSFWIKGALDDLRGELRGFKDENHRDMQTHTESIADLRERVTRLERT